MRLVRHSLGVPLAVAAVAAACSSRPAAATKLELPGGASLRATTEAAVSYDDNALLGRRGQFVGSAAGPAGGGRRADLAFRPSVEVELVRRFAAHDELTLAGYGSLTMLRTSPELRGYRLASSASYSKALGTSGRLAPSARLIYHREQDEWTFRSVEPQVSGRYLADFGLAAELTYRFTLRQFARYQSGTPQPKNSYGNVDAQSHVVEVDLRMWHGSHLRPSIAADIQATRYSGNLTANLEEYSGLPQGSQRSDLGGGVTASLLVLPLPELLLTPAVRYEDNRSNSTPFAYWAALAMLSVLWEPWPGHALYAEIDIGRFDFPKERFDRRYSNTRLDFRRDLKAAYRFGGRVGLGAELALYHLASVSNDCSAFSPLRDELGLPVYSRSYSCFDQNRAELVLRYVL